MSDQFVTGDHIRAEPWPDLDIALIAERDFACVVCWVFPQSLDRRVEGLGEPSGPLGRKLGIGALLFVPTIRFHAHVSSGLDMAAAKSSCENPCFLRAAPSAFGLMVSLSMVILVNIRFHVPQHMRAAT